MPSSARSASEEAGIRDSLVLIGGLVHATLPDIERQFRSRLALLGLPPEQRRRASRLTPGAGARALGSAQPVREFLCNVTAAARELALSDVDRKTVLQSLSEYVALIGPLIRKLPREERAFAKAAQVHLSGALRLLIHEAYALVCREELGLVKALLMAEDGATDESGLACLGLGVIVRHFQAEAGVWFRPDEVALVCLAAHGIRDEVQAARSELARTLRHRLRVLDPDDRLEAPAILVPAWRSGHGLVWSVPAGAGILQVYFADKRQIYPQQSHNLRMACDRCTVAMGRLNREQRLRNMSLRMLEVEELERRRIARELHDDAGQSLVVARLHLEMVETALPAEAEAARKTISEIRGITEKTIIGVRKLISDLSPAVLVQLGLGAAIRQLANRFRAANLVGVRLHLTKLPRLDPRLELVTYRILQECFSNISRHSCARHVNISLSTADRSLRVIVEDDGVGFRVEEGLGRQNCFGLLGIRERVSLLGGKFHLESTPRNSDRTLGESPGMTKIVVEFPLSLEYPEPVPL